MSDCLLRISRLILPTTASLLLCGCSEEPVRSYVVQRDAETVVTTDALRSQYPVLPFQWSVPSNWREAENDQFSDVAWEAGKEDSAARITLTKLPARSGMEAQIVRWRRQLGLETDDVTAAMKENVSSLKLKRESGGEAVDGAYVKIEGGGDSILGVIVELQGTFYIFKYRAAVSTAAAGESEFRAFAESLRVNSA